MRRGATPVRADRLRDVPVQSAFGRVRHDDSGAGKPARKHQGDLASAVTDHDFAQPGTQPTDIVGRLDSTTNTAVAATEVARRSKQTGPHQVDQLEKVIEPVLHRCRGEQQKVWAHGPQVPGQAARRASGILDPVGPVHDHQIPMLGNQRLTKRGARRPPTGWRPARWASPQARGSGKSKLPVRLVSPLPDQSRRGQHQHPVRETPGSKLARHQPCLDRLAEPHLVGQDGPAVQARSTRPAAWS